MSESQFTVKLTPRGGANRIDRVQDGVVYARVAAAPTDGKANVALVQLISDTLGVSKTSVQIESGHTSRTKRVSCGLAEEDLWARLNPAGGAAT